MKHKLTLLLLLLSTLVATVTLYGPTHQVYAACDPAVGKGNTSLGNAESGDCAEQTSFKFNNKNKEVGITDLFVEVIRFLSIAVGIAVVGGIITGGIVYSTGGGNPTQTKKGVTIIVNAIIGLVLYLLMFAIINFLVPGGVLT